MSDWNPSNPNVLGPEWSPYVEGGITLDGATKVACMAMRQTVSQAIDTVKVRLGTLSVRGGMYAVEVYDGETAVGGANLTTVTARPNEDVSGVSAGDWREDDDTTTSIYDQIDEATLDTADYIYNNNNSSGLVVPEYYGRLSTGSLSLTGKRILSAKLRVWARWDGSGGQPRFGYGLNLGGTDYTGQTEIALPTTGQWYETEWTLNPSTNQPWTIAQIQALDTTDEWWIGMRQTGDVLVAMVELVVTICDETRIAVGYLDDTSSALTADAYNTVTMTAVPSGTWTKDGAGYHTYLIRRISSTGAAQIVTLDSGTAPDPAYAFPSAVLNATYGYATAMGTAGTALIPLVQHVNAGSDSVDSQPYAQIVEALVYTGRDAEQEVSDATGQDYGQITFLAKVNAATQALNIKIKRRSDNAQLGATASVSTAFTGSDVESATVVGSGGWRRVVVNLPTPATLATATQYYIEFSSASLGTGTDYWSIATGDTETVGDAGSFGGTTDRAVVNGTEANRYDLFATLAGSPVTPSSFGVGVGSQSIDSSQCGVSFIQRAELSWSPTGLAAEFSRYEIQQTDDAGVTWETIRYITDEDVSSVYVYDVLRGVATSWRIRVKRADGATSDWSDPVAATLPAAVVGAALLLVSDYDPTLNVAYDRDPEVAYEFLDAEAGVEHPIYGRDYQMAFQPTEVLGVRASYTLPLSLGTSTAPGGGTGLAAYAPLRAIATAQIPYVTIIDGYGGRLRAKLKVPSGQHSNPAERHVAQLIAVEVTQTPYIVTVSA
jgi:hypothetical protein